MAMQLDNSGKSPSAEWRMALAVLAAAPLWLASVLAWSRTDPVNETEASAFAVVYAVLLLAFLAGARWGAATRLWRRKRVFMFDRLAALGCAALAFSALFLPAVLALGLLVAAGFAQALWDLTSAEEGRLDYAAANARIAVTAVAITALLSLLPRSLG